ncbi:MAG: hypothetical protein JWR68_3409 [Polaromonas sp.]|nr:hypothetical protein [Polaromonas sp.]
MSAAKKTTKAAAAPAVPVAPAAPAAPVAPTPPAKADKPIHEVFTSASVMELLWKKSRKRLSPNEMEWFADGAIELIGAHTRALAEVVDNTAYMVSNDKRSGSFQDSVSTSQLLFNLQNQLSTIAGLAHIAEEANYSVRKALKEGGK